MNSLINPKMIVLARESRGMSQQSLADKMKINKTLLSRLENGDAAFTRELLYSIADATAYPDQFFIQKGDIIPLSLAYRKRQKVPARIIVPIEAQINIMRLHMEVLTGIIKTGPPAIPVYEVTKERTPAIIAGLVRKAWKINTPVIVNLVKLLEEKGLLINQFDFGTERVDSKSILTASGLPVVFLNSTLLGDRQRFSLAYELGHLVMHTFVTVPFNRDIAHEANEFAAAFLLPENFIRKELENGISLPLLGELKRKWKVSMIALLYRADDLGLLTPNQKRYLEQQFNQLRIRKREPAELDVPVEHPQFVNKLIAGCIRKKNLHITGISALLSLQENEFLDLYGEPEKMKSVLK